MINESPSLLGLASSWMIWCDPTLQWQAGQVEVSANKNILTKFKQQRGLEEVALRLGLTEVYF
jgi:hypothetical protein